MPTISMFYGIKILMYYDEHNPPHFHAKYNEFKVLIGIKDLSVIDGYLPPKALGLVVEWALQHRDELMVNWDAAFKGEILNSIEPL